MDCYRGQQCDILPHSSQPKVTSEIVIFSMCFSWRNMTILGVIFGRGNMI